jgi:hypothetical protein
MKIRCLLYVGCKKRVWLFCLVSINEICTQMYSKVRPNGGKEGDSNGNNLISSSSISKQSLGGVSSWFHFFHFLNDASCGNKRGNGGWQL